MLVFVINAVIWTIVIGFFLSLIFTSGMKNGWKRWIIGAIISITIGCAVAGLISLQSWGDEKTWNNGKCSCGGGYELINVEHLKSSGNLYYYSCDECNYLIETHSYFN